MLSSPDSVVRAKRSRKFQGVCIFCGLQPRFRKWQVRAGGTWRSKRRFNFDAGAVRSPPRPIAPSDGAVRRSPPFGPSAWHGSSHVFFCSFCLPAPDGQTPHSAAWPGRGCRLFLVVERMKSPEHLKEKGLSSCGENDVKRNKMTEAKRALFSSIQGDEQNLLCRADQMQKKTSFNQKKPLNTAVFVDSSIEKRKATMI